MPRTAIDCPNCQHLTHRSRKGFAAYGLEPDASLVILTERLGCTRCRSRAVVAYRYVEDDMAPTPVPRN